MRYRITSNMSSSHSLLEYARRWLPLGVAADDAVHLSVAGCGNVDKILTEVGAGVGVCLMRVCMLVVLGGGG